MRSPATSSQWERLRLHLGDWHGSFDRYDPDGCLCSQTPSRVTLTPLEDSPGIRQTVQWFSSDEESSDPQLFEVRSLSRGMLLCETGAFSQGSLQFNPYGTFGAEFGFVEGDRRLRLVLQFQVTDASSTLQSLTLIHEHRANTKPPPLDPFNPNDLMGIWNGTATHIDPTWHEADPVPTQLHLERTATQLSQTLASHGFRHQSSGIITANRIQFDTTQVFLLPGGASCTVPTVIPRHHPFFLEAGWLCSPTERHRLMRSFNA